MKKLLFIVALALGTPTFAYGVAGTCTATTSGPVCSVTWTGANCGDVADNGPGCPDSDDNISISSQSVTFDQDITITNLNNAPAGGTVVVESGITLAVTAQSGGSWSGATSTFVAEPGSTLSIGAPHNQDGGTFGGRNILQGQKIADVTLATSYGGCSGAGNDQKLIHLTEPHPEIIAGDILMFTSGYNLGQTFEVESVLVADPTQVTLDLSKRDPNPYCGDVTVTSVADSAAPGGKSRCLRVDTSQPDLIDTNSQKFIGKFFSTGGVDYGPIVATDAQEDGTEAQSPCAAAGGNPENDDLITYAWVANFTNTIGEITYGFEGGGDTAIVYRPVRIINNTPSSCNGATQCDFRLVFTSGSRSDLQYLDVSGMGLSFTGITQGPSEYINLSYFSIHDDPATAQVPLSISNGTTGVTVEYFDLYSLMGGPFIALSGKGDILRRGMIRDGVVVNQGIQVARVVGDPGPVTIEDVSGLRISNLLTSSSETDRPEIRARRLTFFGAGARFSSGIAIFDVANKINPADTGAGRNPHVADIVVANSVLVGPSASILNLVGKGMGQNVAAVNNVISYAGVLSPAGNQDAIYRGESFHNVGEYNYRHGFSEATFTMNSVARYNALRGVTEVPELCTFSTCTPTPAAIHVLGNLSYGNGAAPYALEEYGVDAEVLHNSFMTTLNVPAALDITTKTDVPTVSNPLVDCTPSSNCDAAGGWRPTWWSLFTPPDSHPNLTIKDNILGHPGGDSATSNGLQALGTLVTGTDVITDWNYLFGWADPDIQTGITPGANDLVNQVDPFVDSANNDYRLASALAGSDGFNRGASITGVVSGDDAMPPVYAMIKAQGQRFYYPMGDWIYSMDPLGVGKSRFQNFTMTGMRIQFQFSSTPSMLSDPCGFGSDNGEQCGTLNLMLFRSSDNAVITNTILVPVTGADSLYSVHENAIVLGFLPIADAGSLRVSLTVGGTESPATLWLMSEPYAIASYNVPEPGAGSVLNLSGTAQGGTIDLTISGATIQVTTVSGQSAEEVAQAVADAINGNLALASVGISATSSGASVTTNGNITSITINDPGLFQSQTEIPALSFGGVLLALLAGVAVRALWKTSLSQNH